MACNIFLPSQTRRTTGKGIDAIGKRTQCQQWESMSNEYGLTKGLPALSDEVISAPRREQDQICCRGAGSEARGLEGDGEAIVPWSLTKALSNRTHI